MVNEIVEFELSPFIWKYKPRVEFEIMDSLRMLRFSILSFPEPYFFY